MRRIELDGPRSETGIMLWKCMVGLTRGEESKEERVEQVLNVYQR